ncbi:MAG: MBL fold metallo-hydrolase [Bacillota bacterium]
MEVLGLRVGLLSTNCYIVWDEGKQAVVIDPGGHGERIVDEIHKRGLTLVMVINTHGHVDHIAANTDLMAATGAKLAIHRFDAPYLSDDKLNLAGNFQLKLKPLQADLLLEDGQEITVGSMTFQVIHTPGHTPGGICLQVGDALFSGDTLFAGSIGRTDLPGGDQDQLLQSLREKIVPLPEQLTVYPGHDRSTTLAHELRHNPWLRRSKQQ